MTKAHALLDALGRFLRTSSGWAKVLFSRSRPTRNVPPSALPTLAFALPLVAPSALRSQTTAGAWHHSASPPVVPEPGLPPNMHQQLTSPALLCAAISARCGRGDPTGFHPIWCRYLRRVRYRHRSRCRARSKPKRCPALSAIPHSLAPRRLYLDACWPACWRLAYHHACLSRNARPLTTFPGGSSAPPPYASLGPRLSMWHVR